MTQYFTAPFFEEVARRLNADPEWSKKAAAVSAKVVLTCVDRNASFLLDVVNGRVTSTPVDAGQDHLGADCQSEEHTSELQSPDHLVCRLLLEKKKNNT